MYMCVYVYVICVYVYNVETATTISAKIFASSLGCFSSPTAAAIHVMASEGQCSTFPYEGISWARLPPPPKVAIEAQAEHRDEGQPAHGSAEYEEEAAAKTAADEEAAAKNAAEKKASQNEPGQPVPRPAHFWDEAAVWCRACGIWLNGPTQWGDHIIGQQHKQQKSALAALEAA